MVFRFRIKKLKKFFATMGFFIKLTQSHSVASCSIWCKVKPLQCLRLLCYHQLGYVTFAIRQLFVW